MRYFLFFVGALALIFICLAATVASLNWLGNPDNVQSINNGANALSELVGKDGNTASTPNSLSTAQPAILSTPVPVATSSTGSNSIVGGRTINVCTEAPLVELQIEPLVENGQVIPSSFMGLDLNRAEVDNELRYVITIPEGAYAHYFEAWTGTTWEAVGPTNITSTAWTTWCDASGWISEQGFQQYAGKHRQLNANSLPEPVGTWINK